MKGKLLNSTTHDGVIYGYGDVNGIIDVTAKGLDDTFYGGRVRRFGKVDGLPILLCIEKDTVIDIFIPEEEESTETKALEKMSRNEIIAYAKKVGVQGKIATMGTEVLLEEINKIEGR
jgi:hypothetical protein